MDRDEREKTILEAALAVFGQKGYAETRMADIAKEAGMSYGLIYHYFENKESLFECLAAKWWRGFYERLDSLAGSSLATEEKLVAVMRYVLDIYRERPDFISLFVTEISRGFAYHGQSRSREQFLELFRRATALMAEGQESGFLDRDIDPRYLAYIFLGAIDTFLSVMILGKEKLTDSRAGKIVESIMAVFLKGACRA